MTCTKPVRLKTGLLVPCGKCLACRMKVRTEWSIRCIHELSMHNKSAFVTLTYNDLNLPEYQSLKKKDLQNFFKRLRKDLSKEDRKMRYFAAGEYGKKGRPHYHMILFGVDIEEHDRELVKRNWAKCDWNEKEIEIGSFGYVSPNSIYYVSKYIQKKYSGDLADKEYADKNREPVFKIASLGIGRDYADKHWKQIKELKYCMHNGVKHALPRYYINRLDVDTSEREEEAEKQVNKTYERYTGLTVKTVRDRTKLLKHTDHIKYIKGVNKARKQTYKNMSARLSLFKQDKLD